MNNQRNYQKGSRPAQNHDVLITGKIPPQAIEVEQAVLGSIMMDKSAYDIAAEMLLPESFYQDRHQSIFKAMQSLASKSQPIDILTVSEELQAQERLGEVGGKHYVTSLTNSVVSGAHTQHYCRIVVQRWIGRQVIDAGVKMVSEAYEGQDEFDVLDRAEEMLSVIRNQSIKRQFKNLGGLLVESLQELESKRHRSQHLTGVTSGFEDLDKVTCGWQNTDLVIIAARPSVGKTAFALNLARNAALCSHERTPIGFFSLEMNDGQLTHRLLSAESEIWLWKLRNARIDDNGMKNLYQTGVQPLSRAEIILDDTPALNISEFRSKARRMVNKEKAKLIIVDYLQLMTVRGIQNREQQISEISRQLKATAKELKVPIIALSQMSREYEKNKGREPQLSDLRESGAIEQDADAVMFLWRPTDQEIAEDASLLNVCYAAFKKHRNGALAKFLGDFQKEIQKWKFLKVVDDKTLLPIGGSWSPISKPPPKDYTESNKHDFEAIEDLPF